MAKKNINSSFVSRNFREITLSRECTPVPTISVWSPQFLPSKMSVSALKQQSEFSGANGLAVLLWYFFNFFFFFYKLLINICVVLWISKIYENIFLKYMFEPVNSILSFRIPVNSTVCCGCLKNILRRSFFSFIIQGQNSCKGENIIIFFFK